MTKMNQNPTMSIGLFLISVKSTIKQIQPYAVNVWPQQQRWRQREAIKLREKYEETSVPIKAINGPALNAPVVDSEA